MFFISHPNEVAIIIDVSGIIKTANYGGIKITNFGEC